MTLFSDKVVATPYDIGYEADLDDDPHEDADLNDGFIPTADSGSELEAGERFVDYSDRSPRDVVLSGPVLGGWGPGRYHRSRRVAFTFLASKHGEDNVKNMSQSKGRWSFLVKNLRSN